MMKGLRSYVSSILNPPMIEIAVNIVIIHRLECVMYDDVDEQSYLTRFLTISMDLMRQTGLDFLAGLLQAHHKNLDADSSGWLYRFCFKIYV
jgi:hypothetical protein